MQADAEIPAALRSRQRSITLIVIPAASLVITALADTNVRDPRAERRRNRKI